MPRENRKRGKKHKKHAEDQTIPHEEPLPDPQPAGPSWIVSAPENSEHNEEAPFGYVDAEVKAYFRTVDLQIREWQEEGHGTIEADANGDIDPNEDRRMFFVAALTEMSGKEKQLATDPDCSSVLERMAYSMDDFARRVFVDRLTGSFERLLKHRFASHVCQTLFTVARDTISRESRGIFPPSLESTDEGDLLTLTQLILDICEEILPVFSTLIMDPFASHVIRELLILLSPRVFSSDTTKPTFAVRSRKSVAYKARQGPMKSVFTSPDGPSPEQRTIIQSPETFEAAAERFVVALKEQLDGNEVRALAANNVASPVLQMLLELEAAYSISNTPDSITDRVLVGLITLSHTSPGVIPEPSDYLMTLLRDPTASHLLETLVMRSPDGVFDALWITYFNGKLGKLAVHPVANFVVARVVARAGPKILEDICIELLGVGVKLVRSARTGILRALVERAVELGRHEHIVLEAIFSAFELELPAHKAALVPCILSLKAFPDFRTALDTKLQERSKADHHDHQNTRIDANEGLLEPTTQGALLLQSMLRASSPHIELVLDGFALSADDFVALAHNATSSRVLDALLESPTVSRKAKRTFVLSLIYNFLDLVDDKFGSRIGERCWAFADPYLKEKIARSLIPHEQALAASFYGRFFARRLNLHLLQRNPEQWKSQQAESKHEARGSADKPVPQQCVEHQPTATVDSAAEGSRTKRKRKAQPEDEIDVLFNTTLGKKIKKGVLSLTETDAQQSAARKEAPLIHEAAADKGLQDIFGAIRSAPNDGKAHLKKRRAR